MPSISFTINLDERVKSLYSGTDVTIAEEMFGAINTSVQRENGFETLFDDLDLGMVRWPGGGVAEGWHRIEPNGQFSFDPALPYLFDLSYPDLLHPDASNGRMGFREALEHAIEAGAAFELILPTARYSESPGDAYRDTVNFLERLYVSQEFGPIPERFILDIGNENYTNPAQNYGPVSAEILRAIRDFRTSNPLVEFEAGLQVMQTPDGTSELIRYFEQLESTTDLSSLLMEVDIVRVHALQQGLFFGSNIEEPGRNPRESLDLMIAAIEAAGGSIDDIDIFFSAWSSISNPNQTVGLSPDPSEGGMALSSVSSMLSLFTGMLELGATGASVWGIGVSENLRTAIAYIEQLNGEESTALAPVGVIFGMMAESLPGMNLISTTSLDSTRGSSDAFLYAFSNDNQAVFFLAADDLDEKTTVDIEIENIGEIARVWIEYVHLDGLYQGQPFVERRMIDWNGGAISLDLERDYDVVRIIVDLAPPLATYSPPQFSDNDDLILGDSQADSILSGLGDDTVRAGAGNDTINGQGGSDRLSGGGGSDSVLGGAGDDIISGDAGRDTLIGGDGADTIFGNSQADLLNGDLGDDILWGGTGDDTLFGSAGRDHLLGGDGSDYLLGGDGRDIIEGNRGDDRILGGDGADHLAGGVGNDTILAENGDDRLLGGGGSDYLHGGQGDDTLYGNGDSDRLLGGFGNDVLYGGYGNDVLIGHDGNDWLFAGSGDDSLDGGRGGDILDGGLGIDFLAGGEGSDSLSGGAGDDILNGESIDATYDPVAAQVFRLYQATLDRGPDAVGLEAWTGRLISGAMSLQEVAADFVNSPEFRASYGATSNAEFVTLLYNNVLGRKPDTTGLANWTDRLDSGAMSRAEVVQGFSESLEFSANTVAGALNVSLAGQQADWSDDVFRLYQATLDRAPDAVGFDRWTGDLGDGVDYLSVISGFVNSPEFQSTYGATTNVQFVTLLYNNVLGRNPDAAGLANWTDRLDSGAMSRAEVVSGFAQSPELRTDSADALEAWMRGQGGDQLAGGSGDNILFGGIGADTFVFDTADGGTQVIADIEAWDTVEIENSNHANVNALIASLTEEGGDVVLNDNGTTIRFENTTMSQFDTDMFVFA